MENKFLKFTFKASKLAMRLMFLVLFFVMPGSRNKGVAEGGGGAKDKCVV